MRRTGIVNGLWKYEDLGEGGMLNDLLETKGKTLTDIGPCSLDAVTVIDTLFFRRGNDH